MDFSREDFKPLMEHEVNGLDYRYVNSDKARLSVVVQSIENGSASLLDAKGELHAYYHTDYLGSTDYLTSAVNSKVISWTSYSEWGEITHNAVLKCGQRELDLVKEYATHDFDAVLNMYYAKARFYDADNRHFAAVDPILDPSGYDLRNYITVPMALNQYLYVRNNAVNWIDPFGLWTIAVGGEFAAAFGIRIAAGLQLAFDDDGNIGFLRYSAIGGGFPAIGASIVGTVTNADTIYDLKGVGVATGGSMNIFGASAGLEFVAGSARDGSAVLGFTIAFGGELKLLVEMHGEMTITTIISANWLKHFLDLDQIRADYFSKLSCAQKSAIAGIIGDFI